MRGALLAAALCACAHPPGPAATGSPVVTDGPAPAWLRPGTRLTWAVRDEARQYDFVVTVRKAGTEVVFDWEMGPPVGIAGRRAVPAADLDASARQDNRFQGGERATLEGASSVWLSRSSYHELAEHGRTRLWMDGDGPLAVATVGFEQVTVPVRGKPTSLRVLHARSDAGHEWWVLAHPRHPVIVGQQVGFEVRLRAID